MAGWFCFTIRGLEGVEMLESHASTVASREGYVMVWTSRCCGALWLRKLKPESASGERFPPKS
jgi:hypothetical protein